MTETAVAEKRKIRHDYTDLEIDAGLTAFAICSGRMNQAKELLERETDYEVPAETIRSWAQRTYPDRYERIRSEVAPKLQRQMADTHQALADMAGVIETEAADKLHARLKTGEVEDKDLGNIYKSAAIVSGIHTEKAELLNGRPTQRAERSADEVIRSLKGRGLKITEERAEEEAEGRRVSAERVVVETGGNSRSSALGSGGAVTAIAADSQS